MPNHPPKLTIGVLASKGSAFENIFPIFWKCLQNQTFQDFEVLIWDNFNLPETKTFITSKFPDIKFFQSQKGNLGWSKGQNQMISKSKSEFFLTLNYSQVFPPDFLQNLIQPLLQNPQLASSTPQLFKWPRNITSQNPLPELQNIQFQTIDSAGFRLHPDFRVTNFGEGDSAQNQSQPPAIVFGGTGSALLLRKSALQKIQISPTEFFDESFWMWKEDVDLAFRFTLQNLTTIFVPTATSWYLRSASTPKSATIFHAAKHRFQRSNFAQNKFHSSFGQDLLLTKFFFPNSKNFPFKINLKTRFHKFLRNLFEFVFEPQTFWKSHHLLRSWKSKHQKPAPKTTMQGGIARSTTPLLQLISHPRQPLPLPRSPKPKISISVLGFGIGREGTGNYVAAHYHIFLQKVLNSKLDFPVEIFIILNDQETEAWHELSSKFTSQTQNPNIQIHFITQPSLRTHRNFTSFTTPLNFAQNYLATGDIRITTNEDINFEPDTLSQIANFMDKNPQAGVMAPRMIHPDKRVMPTARAFPKLHTQVINRLPLLQKIFSKEFARYHHLSKPIFSPLPVDWVCGHLFVVREKTWHDVKGKDERFFRFMSDTDLCKSAQTKDWQVIYNPEITVTNRRPLSSPGGFTTFLTSPMMQIHLLDALRYFWKWKGK